MISPPPLTSTNRRRRHPRRLAAFHCATTQLIEYEPRNAMTGQFTFSADKAQAIGETIGIDDDEIATRRIALAHLNEFPDYYTRLANKGART